MNLAKFFVASICLTAMTASAGFIKTNSFEGQSFLGSDWSGPGLTINSITNLSTGVTDDSTPLVGYGDSWLLNLQTDGATWTNTVEQSFAGTPIYADMLVKFVPSEDLPTLDSMVKLAIAVTNGLLAVTKKNDDTGFSQWISTSTAIDTGLWYRVTVTLSYSDPIRSANVKINGTNVMVEGNATFTIPDSEGYAILKSIGFQGTGFIDEVVVRDDPPFSGSVLITLSFATGIQSVYIVGGAQKLDTETVPDGTDLLITAAQWKEIASVSGVTATWVAGAAGDSIATVKVESAISATATITAQTETSTTSTSGTGTSFDGAPMDKVARWALTNQITTLTSGMYTNYLYNILTNSATPTLLINSIAVSNTTATVTVGAGTVDFNTINGTLKISAYPVLGGTATNYPVIISGTTNVTITQDIGTNKFIKAIVE